jgi:histone deacetylase HOS3
MCDSAESRLALSGKELVRPRTEGSDGAVNGPELHSGDLYLCSESLDAFQGALGGVCDGIDAVFDQGPTTRAFVCIRPPGHHCSADFPSGFCWVNNVLVGISYAAMNHGLTHAAILDFDLHHGDGSQDIVWDHNYKASMAPRNAPAYKKTAIGYYSLHDINSYPCEGGEPDKVRNASVCVDNAHGQSVWNVHLETWETEAEFWDLYQTRYITLINKARKFLRAQSQRLAETPGGPAPKAAIFISAGFDASEWEGTGMQRHKVNVPTEFYARFTADVVRMSQEEGLGVDGRVISVLEGGYSDRALTSGVLSHLAGLGDSNVSLYESASTGLEYESKWWSANHLSELESLTSPQVKREKTVPTFLASTKSFDAKVLTVRDRKSFGSHTGINPSLPPPPQVDWATAAYELSKILIPEESRQTMSYRAEDLNAEASRQRRERQLALDGVKTVPVPPPPPPEEKRQLRVRKAKSPTPFSPRPATPRQQAMRKNRRRTIDGNELPDQSGELSPSLDASRRKSTNTSAMSTEPMTMGNLEGSEAPALVVDTTAMATPSKIVSARKTSGGSRAGHTPRRSASPRKQPPVPKVPTVYLPSKRSDEAPANDVENLSAGFRRIKLVLPSPEEQAAREKKAAEERKIIIPKTPRSSARSVKKPGATNSPRNKSSFTRSVGPSSSPPRLSTDDLLKSTNADTQPIPSPWESVKSSMMDTTMQDYAVPESSASYFPESTFQPSTNFNTNSSPPFTPNLTQGPELPGPQSNTYTAPMAAGQTKQGLPVFTSSSPIPFAAPAHQQKNPGQDN